MSNKQNSAFLKGKCPVAVCFSSKGKARFLRCGKWDCQVCRKFLARKAAIRVKLHIAFSGGDAYFWTLTMSGKIRSKDYAYSILPRLWNTFRQIIQRALSNGSEVRVTWQYFAFVEGQPKRNHMPHLHIVSMDASPARIKDIAVRAGFGYQAKAEKVSSSKAAEYVAKYASKGDAGMPRGFRRIRPSKRWTKDPVRPKSKLIVPLKGEPLPEFLTRVADITGVEIETLYDRWNTARAILNDPVE